MLDVASAIPGPRLSHGQDRVFSKETHSNRTVLILESETVKTRVAMHAGGRCVACRNLQDPRWGAQVQFSSKFLHSMLPLASLYHDGAVSGSLCSTANNANGWEVVDRGDSLRSTV